MKEYLSKRLMTLAIKVSFLKRSFQDEENDYYRRMYLKDYEKYEAHRRWLEEIQFMCGM